MGVCLYSSQLRVGGMLHCLSPKSSESRNKAGFRAAKYADSGLIELIDELKRVYGVDPRQLTAKIFGGACMLKSLTLNIGHANEAAVREILRDYHIPILNFKTGGDKGYQIDFNLENGAVGCRIFGQETQEF